MEYNAQAIEKKWQEYWKKNKIYKVEVDHSRPKYYVLDMFPYPSGAGLHVGHPLGYIASDIYSRFKRLQGFNVLHPMGYDAFGLPAEQYAIQTGQHPATTTENNIRRYREQMDKIGFSYDWDREVRTCDPGYYKWTQWAFILMFKHFYNNKTQKAEPVEKLVEAFATDGTAGIDAACSVEMHFTAEEWRSYGREKATGDPPQLPSGLSCRDHGELVPGPGDSSCQRRGEGGYFHPWRTPRGTEEDAAMAPADHRLCSAAGERPRRHRVVGVVERDPAELDRSFRRGRYLV